jgi:hypothetical protein
MRQRRKPSPACPGCGAARWQVERPRKFPTMVQIVPKILQRGAHTLITTERCAGLPPRAGRRSGVRRAHPWVGCITNMSERGFPTWTGCEPGVAPDTLSYTQIFVALSGGGQRRRGRTPGGYMVCRPQPSPLPTCCRGTGTATISPKSRKFTLPKMQNWLNPFMEAPRSLISVPRAERHDSRTRNCMTSRARHTMIKV